jgi:hypothetical protein
MIEPKPDLNGEVNLLNKQDTPKFGGGLSQDQSESPQSKGNLGQ